MRNDNFNLLKYLAQSTNIIFVFWQLYDKKKKNKIKYRELQTGHRIVILKLDREIYKICILYRCQGCAGSR